MTTPHSPDGTFPTFPLDLVNDGEVFNHDAVMKSVTASKGLFEKLINGVGWLKTRVDASNGTGVSATRVVPVAWQANFDPDDWQYQTNGFVTLVNTAVNAICELHLPNSVMLTGIDVSIDPAGSHVGLPQFMPNFGFHKRAFGAVGVTTLFYQNDTTGVLGTYEAPHLISKAGLTEAIDTSANAYIITVTSESGTNALAGFKVCDVRITYIPV